MSVGIDLLRKTMVRQGCDEDALDILNDVAAGSGTTAQEALNEVLLYGKLGGGILELETSSFNAKDFLKEYSSQFNIKASRQIL